VYQFDLATARMHAIHEVPFSDPAGVLHLFWLQTNGRGDPYVYTYFRALTDLYIANTSPSS
jgi:hypothetical protein